MNITILFFSVCVRESESLLKRMTLISSEANRLSDFTAFTACQVALCLLQLVRVKQKKAVTLSPPERVKLHQAISTVFTSICLRPLYDVSK